MAANRVRKFLRLDDVQFFLNGAIVGGSFNRSGVSGIGGTPMPLGLVGLIGKTLVFTAPAITVTFTTADGVGGSAEPGVGTNPDKYTLFFKDIKLQIEAAAATLLVIADGDQKLIIVEKTPTSGVTLNKTGTANSVLGFDNQNPTAGKVYTPAEVNNAAPCWVWAYSGNDNQHTIYTWE
jgi:hypothetical protein